MAKNKLLEENIIPIRKQAGGWESENILHVVYLRSILGIIQEFCLLELLKE